MTRLGSVPFRNRGVLHFSTVLVANSPGGKLRNNSLKNSPLYGFLEPRHLPKCSVEPGLCLSAQRPPPLLGQSG
uniref:Uncharacterized protein n=1 Tax=Heterorhabditis bacteriophora TaxID=37862 RepID=A0A1I7WTK2_HETBA